MKSSSRLRMLPVKIAAEVSAFRLQIRPSRIDHLGVFAGAHIPSGRKVIAYAGEKITRAEALRRAMKILRTKKKLRTYFVGINRYWFLDGSVGGNGAERINHCCDPNLKVRKAHGKIHFYSLRPIRKAEELTCDYHFAEERIKIPCHCGSPGCRGFMNRRLRVYRQAGSFAGH